MVLCNSSGKASVINAKTNDKSVRMRREGMLLFCLMLLTAPLSFTVPINQTGVVYFSFSLFLE